MPLSTLGSQGVAPSSHGLIRSSFPMTSDIRVVKVEVWSTNPPTPAPKLSRLRSVIDKLLAFLHL